MNELLKQEIELLPSKPGSYQMRDKDDEIIYIGKAKDLKKRVSQYFYRPQNGKTAVMVHNVDHFTTIVTATEKEALILEMNLIQKYHPRFNILLMDDKHYPYICLHKNIKDPYLSISRNTNNKKNEYFGPFPNSGAAYQTLDIVNKIFPLRKCTKLPSSPCLYYHMHQCLAPCINNIDKEEYKKIILKIESFLKGNNKEVINYLKEKISKYSSELNYEEAQDHKKMLDAILLTSEHQSMEFIDKKDRDFIAFSIRDNFISLIILITRNGRVIFKRSFVYELIGDLYELLSSLISQYYSLNPLPNELIVSTEEFKNILTPLFDMKISNPKRGKLFNLINIAQMNAKEALDEHFQTARLDDDKIDLLIELGNLLKIKTPYRIELFDNSHLMGTNAIGAMVTFINGEKVKNLYRKFNINSLNKADDLSSMKEVLYRHLKRVKEEGGVLPDLILLDGGKTQIEIGKEVLTNLNLVIPIAGLVKNNKHQTSDLMDSSFNLINLDNNKKLFFLLTRMQDEVHRYAISTHIKKRSKSLFSSLFDEIEGIGKKRKELILKSFPTLEDLKNAHLEELEQIVPNNVALLLYNKIKELK